MSHKSEGDSSTSGRYAIVDDNVIFGDDVTAGHYVVVDSATSIGSRSRIGHHTVIGRDVRIGDGCEIGTHVVIHDGTHVGDAVRIDDGACIGKQPMRAPNSAVTGYERQPPVRIGSHSIVGSGVVLYAGCVLGEKVLVADLATIREEVQIGDYTIVGRGVAVENKCTIGRYCKLESNAYIAAYSTLEDRVFVAPGVLTSNDNFLGRTEERFKHFKGAVVRRGARLGVGAVILPGKEIEADAVVAAAGLLTKHAAARTVHVGIPARAVRTVPPDQLLENQEWDDVQDVKESDPRRAGSA
jgi:UDP-3-O-[3-hydroxymyristoyl] glucosamine N-acyltransferase